MRSPSLKFTIFLTKDKQQPFCQSLACDSRPGGPGLLVAFQSQPQQDDGKEYCEGDLDEFLCRLIPED